MKNSKALIGLMLLLVQLGASTTRAYTSSIELDSIDPQPTVCIKTAFSSTGTNFWRTVSLKVTNNCGADVDFQNSIITFTNASNLTANAWASMGPLAYPDSSLQITSALVAGKYLASLVLHFPEQTWANTKLPNGKSFVVFYGVATPAYDPNSGKVYLNGSTPIVGNPTINIQVLTPPSQLNGYSNKPVITLTRTDTGASTAVSASFGATTSIANLTNLVTYRFSTPLISYQGSVCSGSFVPSSLTTDAQNPVTTQLSYSCFPEPTVAINVSVDGLPVSTPSVVVTFSPNDNSGYVSKTVSLINGQGSSSVDLLDGHVYSVSSTLVGGYTASVTPLPLTATGGASVTVHYQQAAPSVGKIISYLPGWKTPPPVADLASAGYTHIMVAFGVFSTTQPGQIVSAFDTVTAAYIASLHNAGIKVLLSLGGASTSIANTSVDFHQVLSMTSPSTFQATFIQSIANFVNQYGFDGIDIDIEHGINSGGTFSQPTGDIAVLASIINQLHASNPNFLITLTPQVANISATSGFDATWGNYASLIMQCHASLAWVGIQLYNAGCAYGIDHVCYDPNVTSSPNFSVAMATDLLESWPLTDATGRSTGFQPYVTQLSPSQIVLGYPAPNASGSSDGAPVTPISTIKNAIKCLRTGTSCGSYVPPRTYPGLSGVFNWEVTYDQSNHFGFATGLNACVKDGNCN